MVSVLIANYNYAAYVGLAIESVLAQDYQHFEIVVCDDGSADESCAVVGRYVTADARVILVQQPNQGQGAAINSAFARSRGQVICVLDADDRFLPGKLTQVIEAFRLTPPAGIVVHDLEIIDSRGKLRGSSTCTAEGYVGPDIPTLRMGLPMPQASGLCFRREILGEVLPLPPDRFRSVADWAIAYAAAYLTTTRRIPRPLAQYRIHGANLSGTTSTARRLDAGMIQKILEGMERVIAFVDEFVSQRVGTRVPAVRVRNVLEHRLLLGLLTGNRALVSGTLAHLQAAYAEVPRDYPPSRLAFWRSLAALPPAAATLALRGAFAIFRLQRRWTQVTRRPPRKEIRP